MNLGNFEMHDLKWLHKVNVILGAALRVSSRLRLDTNRHSF